MNQITYNTLIQKLDAFIRKYYQNQIIRGSLYFVGIAVAAVLTSVLLEYFGRFSTSVRAFMFFGLLLAFVLLFVRFIAIPALKLFRLGKVISHEDASLIIGTHFPAVNDKLLNTLQLKRQAEVFSGDTTLLLASIDQRIETLQPVPFASAINFGENRKYLKYVLPPVILAGLLLIIAPSILREGTQRLVSYNVEYVPVAPFTFGINTNELEVPLNSDFELNVLCEGAYVPSEMSVSIEGKLFRLKASGAGNFSYIFRKVRNDVIFRLTADGYYSSAHTLKVLPTASVVDFEIALKYPEYIGKPEETLSNTGNLRIPEGTTIAWNFNTRHADGLNIIFTDTTVALTGKANGKYVHQRNAYFSDNYKLIAFNKIVGARDTMSYRIDVVKDAFPKIQIESASDSTDSRRTFFTGLASDDYGIVRLIFHFNVVRKDASEEKFQESLSLNSQTAQEFYHFKDFTNLSLLPGEQIEYYFEVWDNDRVNGSKSSRSLRQMYKAPSLEELQEERQNISDQIKDKLDDAIKQAALLQKDLSELNKDLLQNKEMSWQEKKRIEDLLKKQKNLEREVESIRNERSMMQQKQENFLQQSESILDKQRQLDKLFDQVMSDDMKEMYKKLEELMKEMDQNAIQQELENLKMDNEQLEKELDRALELFKQMEFEQEFEQTMEKLDQLAEEEERLAQESKEGEKSSEELKEKQDELNKKFEELQKDLNDLDKKNQELESPMNMPNTEQMEENIKQEMEKASEDLEKKKQQKASESQKSAAQQMKDMAKKMQDAMDESASESAQEDMDALRALLENIIQLSFDQEAIMEELRTLEPEDPNYTKIGQKQKKLQDDSKMVEDSLYALSKRVVQIEPIVNQEIAIINKNIRLSLEEISDRITANAAMRQQYSMTSFNNLALLLDEALKQMQQAMANQMPGTGNCQKPGGAGSKPSSGKMSKMQEEMGKKLEQMQKALQKGQTPGDRKPGTGTQQMSMEIAKMAAEQAAIRKEIEKMAQQLNQEGKGAGNGLKEIAEKMEETEKDLVNLKISPETMKRQQDILTRLLESEKADREREQDNKRESKSPGLFDPINPAQYIDYNKIKSREVELLRTVPANLKPYYKDRVNEYFLNFED